MCGVFLKAVSFLRNIDWQRVGRNCRRARTSRPPLSSFLSLRHARHGPLSKGAITILSGLICEHFTRTLFLGRGLPANGCTYHQPRRSFEGFSLGYQVPRTHTPYIHVPKYTGWFMLYETFFVWSNSTLIRPRRAPFDDKQYHIGRVPFLFNSRTKSLATARNE